MISTTVVAQIVAILAIILPLFHIEFDSAQATTIVQAILVLGAAIWTWYQRTHTLQSVPKGQADVNILGVRRD